MKIGTVFATLAVELAGATGSQRNQNAASMREWLCFSASLLFRGEKQKSRCNEFRAARRDEGEILYITEGFGTSALLAASDPVISAARLFYI